MSYQQNYNHLYGYTDSNNPYAYNEYYRPTAPPQMTTATDSKEQYIEQILRFNRGRFAKVYMTFPGPSGSGGGVSKVFYGMILSAGRDHLVVKDFENNRSYLLLMVYLDYVEFEGFLNYILPPPLTTEQVQFLNEQNKKVTEELQQYLNIPTTGTSQTY